MPLLDSYLLVPEAAELLDVHPETIKRLCQRGRMPAEKIHNTWLIPKSAFKEFSLAYRSPRRGRESRREAT